MNQPITTSAATLLLAFAAIAASAGNPGEALGLRRSSSAQTAELVGEWRIDDAMTPAACPAKPQADVALFIAASAHDVSGVVDLNAARPMRGYCRCTCSLIPNCTTNADCGGGFCLKGPTCC
jgi:hypothetical protein